MDGEYVRDEEQPDVAEAFIPRRGDRERSMAILEKAASWYDNLPELDAERLAAVLEGRNDPGYNPPDFPLLQGYDETERGRDH